FVIAVIVFQPELRRALIRLGAAGWLPGLGRDVSAMLDEVMQSVAYLSRNKVGALIAIERNTELGGLIERGRKLDAEVSTPLLNTIFWPGSALHDMGVIISQDRIAAASVLFPLTDNEALEAELGSRHRAAVGLSEESDALVIIVSEETGAVSLAEHGILHRKLAPEALRKMLESRLARRPADADRLKPDAQADAQAKQAS
ncbi:MAG: diadenylate cyclase, partial [Phycisphaerae bacterium]